VDRKAPGQVPRLTAEQLAAARRRRGGIEALSRRGGALAAGRLGDLAVWLREEFGVSVSETTVSRALKRFGFRC
jgi:hypothetical protein